MPRTRSKSRQTAGWVAMAAALLALGLTLYLYLTPHTGIDHEAGTLVVACSTAILLVVVALTTLVDSLPRWLSLLLNIGIFIDILGSGVAAWFLEAEVVLAFLALAFIAWAVRQLIGVPVPGPRPANA